MQTLLLFSVFLVLLSPATKPLSSLRFKRGFKDFFPNLYGECDSTLVIVCRFQNVDSVGENF